ncbi:MAG: hypothetical protein OXF33_09060 [Rhodospirillales bacterium]|nr:hypothetical protein [Rhodospirillales bacterium]
MTDDEKLHDIGPTVHEHHVLQTELACAENRPRDAHFVLRQMADCIDADERLLTKPAGVAVVPNSLGAVEVPPSDDVVRLHDEHGERVARLSQLHDTLDQVGE